MHIGREGSAKPLCCRTRLIPAKCRDLTAINRQIDEKKSMTSIWKASLTLLVIPLLAAPPLPAVADAATPPRQSVVFESVRHYFGNLRGSYFVPDRRISEQVIMGLSGPPCQTIRLTDGNYFISASRAHSGEEKAAVIVTPGGKTLAVGLINFRCDRAGCDDESMLTIYLPTLGDQSFFVQQLKDWEEREIGSNASETRRIPLRTFDR
jgi:hypothetical protein